MSEVKTIEDLQDELASLHEDLKSANDKQLEKIEASGKIVGSNTDQLQKISDAMDAIEERVTKVQAKQDAPATGGEESKEDDDRHKSVMNAYMRFGNEALTTEDRKFIKEKTDLNFKGLTESVNPTAGFLVRPEQSNEIIIGVTEFSPIRQIADVQTISTLAWEGAKETGKDVAVWVSETGSRDESVGQAYGQERIPVHEMSARKSISFALAEDSFVNIEAEVNRTAIRAFATLEGAAHVNGNSIGKPEGFLTNSAVGSTTSKTSNILEGDDFSIVLYGVKSSSTSGLKENYHNNATWVFHRTTLGETRRLKDGNGDYLWRAGLATGVPNTILDRPYMLATDMPVISTGNKAIALGDFKMGYRIIDRIGITVNRIMDSQTMDEGGFRLYTRRRTGGQVILAEAIKLLTIQ